MDEQGNIQLTSPPSSLPDGFFSAQGTVPPIPRPRRGSGSSFSASTPKHLSFYGSLTQGNQSNTSGSSISRHSNCKSGKTHRTSSVESQGNCEIKLMPLASLLDLSDGDSEEEENGNQQSNSSERLNSNCNTRSRKTPHRYVSRSLPVTPRVNGNCNSGNMNQSPLNGGVSSPFVSGLGGSSTPLLMAPHLASHFPLDGSLNSIGSLSPAASQYVTCSSGVLSESLDKVLPGSIDYSSLPLPREEPFKMPPKRHINHHMSEPCIHESNHHLNLGKCHSCPQRRISSKHRRKEAQPNLSNDADSSSGRGNAYRNSFNGFDTTKSDDLEMVEMQWKFIQTLIEELNKCRCQNNRMAVELHQSKMEIQMVKGALDAYTEAGMQPGILAEMIGQIHAAQKIRDEAMMSRIKLANEERDAALNQTRALLEKLGIAPGDSTDNFNFNVAPQHELNNSSLSPPMRASEDGINLTAIEDELKALRFAAMQERACHGDPGSQCKGDTDRQEILDELKQKLKESEQSKMQLQDRCSRLERVFGCLRRKVNGLSSVEGVSLNPTSLTFLDMSVFGPPETGNNSSNHDTESASHPHTVGPENSSSGGRKPPPPEKGDDTEGGESLSSVSSVETSSAASWKHICLNHTQNPDSSHSGGHSHHPSFSFGTTQHLPTGGPTPCSSLSSERGSFEGVAARDENQHNSKDNFSQSERTSLKTDCKPRNLGGVTVMGPITEL